MAFELGTTVGDYQFIDVLDSSRDGTVYKVRNIPEQRYELLRVLSEAAQSDTVRRERFQREGKILARLNHPHIVSYRASTNLAGRFVLATELVEGTSLAERMEVGRLSLPDAVRYVWQALEALECAHAEGVVHRDINPSKLFITADSELKLGGFSLARSTADPRLTQAGVSIGSAHYMSPEQVQATGDLDGRSDLYSLGIVFYELVAGSKPFPFESQFDVMLAQVETVPAPPSAHNPELTPELDAMILKALAKKPAHRFQTAKEFREALMGISLGTVREPTENMERALADLKRKGKIENEHAKQLAAQHDEIAALASGTVPVPVRKVQGTPRKLLFALITLGAVGLFLLTNWIK
jgi:serine/threonine-protein kinase